MGVHVETEMKSITGLPLIPVLLAGSLRGAPRHDDAVRLGGLSQRVPNTCSTNTGAACVFPFLYGGVEYTKCSYADSPVPWCATATRSDGTVITNSWGDCQMDTGTSSCLVETGVSWCSTLTAQQGEHVAGNEGTCPASCPGSVSTTTTTPTPVCVPGSLSSVDCNTCVCSSLGQQVCTTDSCSSSFTTTTTTPPTTTTTTTSTTTTTTPSTSTVASSSCLTVSGPDTGSSCVFPFTFNGVTYVTCADWIYGGSNQGEKWCSTKVDAAGQHVNGEGKYGFCSSDCNPNVSLAAILAGLGINANSNFRQEANTNSVAFRAGSDDPK